MCATTQQQLPASCSQSPTLQAEDAQLTRATLSLRDIRSDPDTRAKEERESERQDILYEKEALSVCVCVL